LALALGAAEALVAGAPLPVDALLDALVEEPLPVEALVVPLAAGLAEPFAALPVVAAPSGSGQPVSAATAEVMAANVMSF
jgi:hypothetical protein